MVVGVRTGIAADLHVVIEYQGIAGNDVPDIDVCHIACGSYCDCIKNLTCCLVENTLLFYVCLSRLRLIKGDVSLDNIIKYNLGFRSIKLPGVGKAEAHIGRFFQSGEVGIGCIKINL